MRPVLIVAVPALALACASAPAPVPVTGAPTDVSGLVGEWTGEYRSVETGRSGSIVFKLDAGQDTANGDVVMVSREPGMSHDDAVHIALTRQAANQVITIRFVRVSGSTVSGTMDPYPSPDCSCQLVTTFKGELKGNRIEGTFRTVHSTHDTPTQQGTWWVTRTK
jgi:hypothetical protein